VLRLLKARSKRDHRKVGADGELTMPKRSRNSQTGKTATGFDRSFEKAGALSWQKGESGDRGVESVPPAGDECGGIANDRGRHDPRVGATSRAQMGAVMKALQPKMQGEPMGNAEHGGVTTVGS